MKSCSKCKEIKEFSEFGKDKYTSTGYKSKCTLCCKEFYKKNKDKHYVLTKKYRENNKEKLNEINKIYYLKNKEVICQKQRIHYNNNKDIKKEYCKNNRDKINAYYRVHSKKRKEKDSLYKLTCNIRTLIGMSIKGKGYTKRSKTSEYLGCTFEEFKKHIENQFKEGMSWENRNLWHLDHIHPISLAQSEEEIIKLNHYTNFQPLWAEENIRKGNRLYY